MKLGPEVRNVSREFEPTRLGVTRERASGRGSWAVRLVAALSVLTGCGYQSVYGHPSQRYGVSPGVYSTSSFEAVSAVTDGVRSELGAAQALGDGFPRVVVEVLRVDERSIGVRAAATGASSPLARGSEIIVVGRARIEAKEGAAPTFDTGDMSRAAQYAAGTSPTADAAARSRAVRDAARQLGKALARSILGIPEPAEG